MSRGLWVSVACYLLLVLGPACRKNDSPSRSDFDSGRAAVETSVEIPTIGLFEGHRLPDGRILCYVHRLRFRDCDTDVIVYPNQDGSPLTGTQKEKLRKRFRQFESSVDRALQDYPRQVRDLCRLIDTDLSALSDDELRRELKWHNIKLDPDGTIECYTDNRKAEEYMDIVLVFSADLQLQYVHFDG